MTSWARRFGGTGIDYGTAVVIDIAGAIIIAGSFQGTVDFGGAASLIGAGNVNAFVAKYSPDGTNLWAVRVGDAGTEVIRCLAVDVDGNIFIAGTLVGGAIVSKLSPDGDILWSAGSGASVVSIATDSVGNAIITGSFQGSADFGETTLNSSFASTDAFLAKYSSAGSDTWAKKFNNLGGIEYGTGVAVDSDDNILLTGYCLSDINLGGSGLFESGYLAKFDASGNHVWSRATGTNNIARPWAIAVDSQDDAIISGDFQHQTDLGGGVITGAAPGTDMFVAKYSGVDGAYQWATPIRGNSDAKPNSMAVDSQNGVFITGNFRGTYNFGSQTLVTTGVSDIYDGFVAKYSGGGVALWAHKFGSTDNDSANAIAVDASGRPVMTGAFSGTGTFGNQGLASAGGVDIFIYRAFIVSPPTDLVVSRRFSTTSYFISWTPSSDVEAPQGYRIYREGMLVQEVGPEQTTFEDIVLAVQPRTYSVSAVADAEESSWVTWYAPPKELEPLKFMTPVMSINDSASNSPVGNFRKPNYVAESNRAPETLYLPTDLLSSFWLCDEQSGPRYDHAGGRHLTEQFRDPLSEGLPVIGRVAFDSVNYAASITGTPRRHLAGELGRMATQEIAFALRFRFPTYPASGWKYPILTMITRPDVLYAVNHQPPSSILSIGIEEITGVWVITVYAGRTDMGVDRFVSGFPVAENGVNHLLVYTTAVDWGVDWGDLAIVRDGVKVSFPRTVPFMECSPAIHLGGNPSAYGHIAAPDFNLEVQGASMWEGVNWSSQNMADLYNGGRGYNPITPLLSGIEAYWRLNEAVDTIRRDSVSGYYDLIHIDNSIPSAAGKLGNAAEFPGDVDAYLFANPKPYDATGLFTIAGWFKMASAETYKQRLVSNLQTDGGGIHRGFELAVEEAEAIAIEIGDGTNTLKKALWDGAVPTPGTWYFVCAGVNAAGLAFISVNAGARVTTASGVPAYSPLRLLFGGSAVGGPLAGLLDEFALWRRALTVDEEKVLYNGGTGLTFPF